MIAAELQKIGINMSIKELPFTKWLVYDSGPKTYGNIYLNDNEIYADPSSHVDADLGSWNIPAGHFNDSGWSTPQLDDLITAGDSTINRSKRLTIYGNITRIVANSATWLPLFVPG